MGERRELPKTQFDQRWETFVEKCVCVCVCDNKKATMVGGPAPTIVGNRSPPHILFSISMIYITQLWFCSTCTCLLGSTSSLPEPCTVAMLSNAAEC